MFFTAVVQRLFGRVGFFKVGLHEIGHSLGLAHPTATPQYPKGQPSVQSSNPGGTVMNPNGGLAPPAPVSQRRDDYLGLVALSPTSCDITAVQNAELFRK
jgi:hypothetical protein